MAKLTQGTQLYFLDPETDAVTLVECPTGITGLGGTRDQVDITCLDSLEAESLPGLARPGEVSVQIQFDQDNTSHVRLFELFQDTSQENIWWAIGGSDGRDIPPTSGDSTGWVVPLTRTYWLFEGYISNMPVDWPLGGVQGGTMTIQRSGRATLSRKTA
jgi:hypothetical protein